MQAGVEGVGVLFSFGAACAGAAVLRQEAEVVAVDRDFLGVVFVRRWAVIEGEFGSSVEMNSGTTTRKQQDQLQQFIKRTCHQCLQGRAKAVSNAEKQMEAGCDVLGFAIHPSDLARPADLWTLLQRGKEMQTH